MEANDFRCHLVCVLTVSFVDVYATSAEVYV